MTTRRKYSFLWNHFENISPKKAKCVYCSRILAISATSIGSLRRHIKSVHPNVDINAGPKYKCVSIPEEFIETEVISIPAIQAQDPLSAASFSTPTTTTITAATTKRNEEAPTTLNNDEIVKKSLPLKRIDQFDEQLIKMIAKGQYDLEMADDKEFRKFVEMLNPTYKLPTRKILLESLLPRVYSKILKSIKNKIKRASSISISTDGWTSVLNDGYVTITAHYIDVETDKLCSAMIECMHLEKRYMSANIKDFLNEKFSEWNIENLVKVIVSNDAANISGAIHLGGWSLIPCFAHTIDLIVQSSIVKISATVNKVKKIVEYFQRSLPSSNELKEIQTQMKFVALKLKQDTVTRWNTTFYMLQQFQNMKDAITSTVASMKSDIQLSEEDWDIIQEVIPLLNIFYEVTVDISQENYVMASKYIVLCKLIIYQIEKIDECSVSSTPVQELVNTLRSQLKQRLGDVESNFLLCEATILDPRFKRIGFRDLNNFERAVESLKYKISNESNPVEITVSKVEPEQPRHSASVFNDSLWEEFDAEISHQVTKNTIAAGVIELDKYMQEPLIKRHENPLKWWSERKSIYPHLYPYMLERLNITATSMPVSGERVFSKVKIPSNDRNTLTTKEFSELMFISSNYDYSDI